MTADEYAAFVESRGRRTKRVRGGWEVECPAHDSVSGSSLSVKDGDKGLLLHCFGGCSFDEIVAADGLDAAELFHERRAGRPELGATYTYVDEQGAPLYEVGRFEPGFDPG